MHKAGSVALIATILLLIPSVAMANAGSPLLQIGFFHLIAGNLFFGFIEGLIIAGILRFDLPRPLIAIPWMILANYVSMIVGCVLLNYFVFAQISSAQIPFSDILQIPSIYQSALVAAFGLTIILEWPFVLAAVKRIKGIIIKSLFACVVAQTVTYAIMILLYTPLINTSIVTVPDYQTDLSFAKAPYATVYYIDPDDGSIWRVLTDGSGREQVAEPEIKDRAATLFIMRQDTDEETTLYARDYYERGNENNPLYKIVSISSGNFVSFDKEPNNFFLRVDDLRESDGQYSIRGELGWYWPHEGITVSGSDEEEYNLAIDLPLGFSEWYFRSVTILPNEQAVFQLADWVVLYDLPTRKIGLIANGRSPVVVIGPQ